MSRPKHPSIEEFDLPGVNADSLSLDVERNTLMVRAETPARDPNQEMVAVERPRGVFSRQLFLGDNLATEAIEATYRDGVLSWPSRSWRRPSHVRSRSATSARTRRSTPDTFRETLGPSQDRALALGCTPVFEQSVLFGAGVTRRHAANSACPTGVFSLASERGCLHAAPGWGCSDGRTRQPRAIVSWCS